jgi:3-hydroxyisobutyrate dehydrogenase-like beta-hydroxyacid dehydrogenase
MTVATPSDRESSPMSESSSAPSDHVVGVLGLGAMGGPIARHLVAAGYPVFVHDLNQQAVDALVALGAKAAGSPAALGENCDAVIVIVPTDEDLLGVCTGPDGILANARPGSVLLMCSSVRPETCDAAAAAAPDGVGVLDAALTGGVRGAEEGQINLLVGGDEAALDRVRPALAPWTSNVHHLGPLGSGQVGKTANNLIHWAQIAVIFEAFELARRLGVPAPKLREALKTGPTDSRTMREIEQMRFTWHVKDIANAYAMAEPLDMPLPLTEASRRAMLEITVARFGRLLQGKDPDADPDADPVADATADPSR